MVHFQAVGQFAHARLAADVAWIDAHFGDAVFHRLYGQPVVEMDVRHQGHGAAVHQRAHRAGALLVVHRNAHQIRPRAGQRANLRQRGLHVPRVRIGHRLHGYRRAAAHANVSHCNRFHFATPLSAA